MNRNTAAPPTLIPAIKPVLWVTLEDADVGEDVVLPMVEGATDVVLLEIGGMTTAEDDGPLRDE